MLHGGVAGGAHGAVLFVVRGRRGNGDVDGTGDDEGNLNPDQGAEAVGVTDAERDQAGAGERPLPSAVRDVG